MLALHITLGKVHCLHNTRKCTVHTKDCKVCTAYKRLGSVQCIQNTVQCALYSTQPYHIFTHVWHPIHFVLFSSKFNINFLITSSSLAVAIPLCLLVFCLYISSQSKYFEVSYWSWDHRISFFFNSNHRFLKYSNLAPTKNLKTHDMLQGWFNNLYIF